MDTKTINGKTLWQVIEELTAEFPEILPDGTRAVPWRQGKFPYIENETYKERLDTVIGLFNYDFMPTENSDGRTRVVSLEGEHALIAERVLTIKYDDGTVAKRVCGTGKRTLQRYTEDKGAFAGKLMDFANDFASVVTSAFVDCCKQLGIGVKDIAKAEKAGCPADYKSGNTKRGFMGLAGTNGTTLKIRFLSTKQRSDRVTKLEGVTSDGESLTVCIWANSELHAELMENNCTLEQLISAGMQKELTFTGTKKEYNGEMQFNISRASFGRKTE